MDEMSSLAYLLLTDELTVCNSYCIQLCRWMYASIMTLTDLLLKMSYIVKLQWKSAPGDALCADDALLIASFRPALRRQRYACCIVLCSWLNMPVTRSFYIIDHEYLSTELIKTIMRVLCYLALRVKGF